MVPGPGTGDAEQVAFCVVDLFQISVIGHCLDSILKRNALVLSGHANGASLLLVHDRLVFGRGNVLA